MQHPVKLGAICGVRRASENESVERTNPPRLGVGAEGAR